MMDHKTALGVLSVAIGAVAYAIYLWQSAKKGGVEPHPFSWILWGIVTAVAYLAQRARGGGAGSWVTAFTALFCLAIGLWSLGKHRRRFNWVDRASLGAGLAILLFYLLARDPTLSAILATSTDLLGFLPTFRKGWVEPHRDSATSFALNGIKFLPATFAVDSYSIASCLFPIAMVIVNEILAGMLVLRRKELG